MSDKLTLFLIRHRIRAIYFLILLASLLLTIHSIINFKKYIAISDVFTVTAGDNSRPLVIPLRNAQGERTQQKGAQPVMASTPADTPLSDLQVTGIIYSNIAEHSRAILKSPTEEGNYRINVPVNGYPGVMIKQIEPNRVVLSNNGKTQLLVLVKERVPLAHQREPARSSEPISLANYIIPTVVYNDNKDPEGLRLNSKVSLAIFRAAGITPGEIAIKMNNYQLKDKDNVNRALKELQQARIAEFTFLRNGQPELVTVSIRDFAINGDIKQK